MDMDMDLPVISTDGSSNGATRFTGESVKTGNGEVPTISHVEATERDELLQAPTSVGEGTPLNRGPSEPTSTPQEESLLYRVQRELNNISPKVKLWMIIVVTIVFIVTIIVAALAVCAAIHEDEDEKYDPSLFQVPLCHRGTFRLPNKVFTEDLINMSSNKSHVLAAELQEKIAGLYTSSPALGRYFSEAPIKAFDNGRNDSVIAHYLLKFLMPEEEEDQLRNFTLSREMVYNVFRQLLYDQEDRAQPLYIAPDSLQTPVKKYWQTDGAEHFSACSG